MTIRIAAEFEREVAHHRLALRLSDDEARQLRAEIRDEAYRSPLSLVWVAIWGDWRKRWYNTSAEVT